MWKSLSGNVASAFLLTINAARHAWPILLLALLDVTDVYERAIRQILPDWAPDRIGVPANWEPYFLAIALTYGAIREYHLMRTSALAQNVRLSTAKSILYHVANAGNEMLDEYNIDPAVFRPSDEAILEWFDEACRVLTEVINPYLGDSQRRRWVHPFDGFVYEQFDQAISSTAGVLSGRASKLVDSDLALTFHSEQWIDYAVSESYDNGSDLTSSSKASRNIKWLLRLLKRNSNSSK